MYSLEISEQLDKKFKKLEKKNKHQLEIINKKVEEILKNPDHYKPLSGSMHGLREVHIDTSFVLTYLVDEQTKVVLLVDYDHHDNIFY